MYISLSDVSKEYNESWEKLLMNIQIEKFSFCFSFFYKYGKSISISDNN